MQIRGKWFDGQRAAPQLAVLHVTATGYVRLEPPVRPGCRLADISISARLGNAPRYIGFADGSQFETTDNEQVDHLLQLGSSFAAPPVHDRLQQWVHRLESCWPVVLASVLLLVVLTGWFAVHGAPLVAREIAQRLPPEVSTYVGRDSLALLDKGFLQPTTLDAARQQQLQALFAGLLPPEGRFPYRLVFRDGGKLGPNALALPDATIVMTDQLVALADDDQQLATVFLHEIGHVEHAHLLRQLIQQAGLAALLVAITGDIAGASEMVLALPGVLMQAHYSRDMETEADSYALAQLQARGLSPLAFARIMQRIEAAHDVAADWQYLSTHPDTAERIRRFEQAASTPQP